MRNILKTVKRKVTPGRPQTRLGHALREMAKTQDNEFNALRCNTAADKLDATAVAMGVKGERVKTLGAYFVAKRVYAEVAGEPYAE